MSLSVYRCECGLTWNFWYKIYRKAALKLVQDLGEDAFLEPKQAGRRQLADNSCWLDSRKQRTSIRTRRRHTTSESLAACKCRNRWGARSTPIRILFQTRKRRLSQMKFIPVHSWLVPPRVILGIIFPVIRVFYLGFYAYLYLKCMATPSPRNPPLTESDPMW